MLIFVVLDSARAYITAFTYLGYTRAYAAVWGG